MMAGRIREYAFCRTMDSLHNNHPDMQETMQSVKETTELRQWFVMRDLKRGNAKQPAYKLLGELKIRFFTPMVWKLKIRQGKRVASRFLLCLICYSFMIPVKYLILL